MTVTKSLSFPLSCIMILKSESHLIKILKNCFIQMDFQYEKLMQLEWREFSIKKYLRKFSDRESKKSATSLLIWSHFLQIKLLLAFLLCNTTHHNSRWKLPTYRSWTLTDCERKYSKKSFSVSKRNTSPWIRNWFT